MRAACDCIGAQRGLANSDPDEFTGWLAAMGQSQEHAALDVGLGRYRARSRLAAGGTFAASAEVKDELALVSSGVEKALSKPDRCRVEQLADGRYLLHNFRRQPGGAPRRLLL